MENRAHAIMAGLFVLALGIALAVAVWWFSGSRESMREYTLVSRGSINGLSEQGRVRFRGMAAGNVSRISIDPADPRNILVHIRIRANIPVTRSTRAQLGTQGVTGLAYVQLEDSGADPTPLTGEGGEPPRLPLEAGLMEQITDTALAAAQRFRATAEQIASLFNDENTARLRDTIDRLESGITGFDRTFAEAPRTLASIRSAFSPENVKRLEAVLDNLERASGEISPAMAEARTLIGRLATTAEHVDHAVQNTGNGLSNGTLPRLNELLRELTVSSRRLGHLIEEVETSPQLLISGRGETRPGPGEPGFSPAH